MMKSERHLAIIMYLLNRELVSAKKLAEKFQVSMRTIQRDIDTLTLAGIPIVAEMGSKGGYSIMDTYRLNKQLLSDMDLQHLTSALKTLDSAIEDQSISDTFEKINVLYQDKSKELKYSEAYDLNLKVLKESSHIEGSMPLIEDAIKGKKQIRFSYTSASNRTSLRTVEPLLLNFRWYAWYLFGYCTEKHDYRLFKVTRMRNVLNTEVSFENIHEGWRTVFDNQDEQDIRSYVELELMCSNDIRVQMEDCFPRAVIEELDEDYFRMRFSVPENERYWFGLILSFGEKVKVLSPESVVSRIQDTVSGIQKTYKFF